MVFNGDKPPTQGEMKGTLIMAIQTPEPQGLPLRCSASAAPDAAGGKVGEFLAFTLGNEEYGIDILGVQEVRFFEAPTYIANAPAYVLGVQNMRGAVVPIIDMRLRFGVASAPYDSRTVTIVLNIENYVVGVVVDAVTDIVRLERDQLRTVPQCNSTFANDHLMGIGVVNGRMLILVDIEKLMTSVESGQGVEILH